MVVVILIVTVLVIAVEQKYYGYGCLGMIIGHPYSRGIYAERCQQLLLHATDYFTLAYSS